MSDSRKTGVKPKLSVVEARAVDIGASRLAAAPLKKLRLVIPIIGHLPVRAVLD
jgi:hypothetical protein